MKVILDNDASTFRLGPDGTPFEFEPGNDDSYVAAFTRAVNEGVEKGVEIEGEAAIQVAEILKAAGEVAWPADSGFNALRDSVQEALPSKPTVSAGLEYAGSSWYVQDISLSADKALVCGWDNGGEENYVVPFTVHEDGSVVVGDKSQWVEVGREFVAKAGRKFSNAHLAAMKEAHDALGKLIAVGDGERGQAADGDETQKNSGPDLAYTVQKANAQMRYTLGPLYAPMREDAHGEWIEDDTLHKALHGFVRDSAEDGRRILLQHGDKGDVTVGEWVEAMRWPYEHTIKVRNAEGVEHEVEMPAGTVYLGVVWDEDYWDVEKQAPKGIDGYSLGGRAMKVRGTSEALKSMGYKVTKADRPPHEYDGGKDGEGPCTSCGLSKSEGNHQ